MKQAGLNLHGANFVQVLSGTSISNTVRYYAEVSEKLLITAGSVIAFLGMGSDGHIAGILPHSPAVDAAKEWAVGYRTEDFERLTLTPFALSHINKAIVGAYGSEKSSALKNLQDTLQPLADQPAQLVRHLPEVMIFNDELGE